VHRATVDLGGVTREVALKRLLPHLAEDDRFVEDFIREAKLAAHLRHPNIIQIHDLGRIGNDYFIAMELVRGISLMSLMRLATKRNTLLPISAVLSLMLELTDALDHAHTGTTDAGEPLELVHRDLTPSNLLISDDGHLKIIDFGIAKANRGDLSTDSGVAKGKLGYMALEAMRAEPVDARADLFSAGVVMWELLTGHRLFKPVNDWEPAAARELPIEHPSKINPQCPSDLDHVVLRAVAKSRDQRWRSAEEMHRMLAPIGRNFAASPAEVVRAKHALRPETTADPYAGFELGFDDDSSLEVVISSTPRPLDWTGSLWPPEPATEPKLMQRVEGTSSWPVEPETEPKMYTSEMLERARREDAAFAIEPPSVQVKELPVTFSPAAFDDPGDTAKTDQVPAIGADTTRKRVRPAPEPPTEPRKPRPRPPAAKRAPPAPFRQGHSSVREPARGKTDRLDEPAGQAIAQISVEAAEAFEPEDTISERDPFDEE
jgi:serine/threonine protein kinase